MEKSTVENKQDPLVDIEGYLLDDEGKRFQRIFTNVTNFDLSEVSLALTSLDRAKRPSSGISLAPRL